MSILPVTVLYNTIYRSVNFLPALAYLELWRARFQILKTFILFLNSKSSLMPLSCFSWYKSSKFDSIDLIVRYTLVELSHQIIFLIKALPIVTGSFIVFHLFCVLTTSYSLDCKIKWAEFHRHV